MGYIWDLMQFAGIRDAQRLATTAHGKAEDSTSAAGSLEARFERLALVCHAMWELLRDSGNVSEEQLISKMREIDLSDGTLDGRRSATIKKCSACHRVMSPRHSKCLYCGAERLISSPFDGI